jgi:hypothetical protein
MKKITILFIGLLLLASSSFAFSKKMETRNLEKSYTTVTILDKGVKREISVSKKISTSNKSNQLNSKEGIIVSFKNPSQITISEFETKYGLKLKTKLVIGYYIFQNISKYSDVQIVGNIIENETNIQTVKPNWKKKNTIR